MTDTEKRVGADGTAGRLTKLRRLSLRAERLAVGGMVLVAAYAAYLPFDRDLLLMYLSREVPGSLTLPPDGPLWLAYGLSLVPAVLFMAAMWKARQLFALLGQGRLFDPAAPLILVRLGSLVIAIALTEVVIRTLVILVMTSANPPGQRKLVIGIGSTEIGAIVAGLLFLAFALVMREALRIDLENREFV